MFEKNDLVLTEKEYDIPELVFQREKLKVVEFPIKPFFESDGNNIEFIHKSVYEYFVAEYIFYKICKTNKIIENLDNLAEILSEIFNSQIINEEIVEYLSYKVLSFELNGKALAEVFSLMLRNGMLYCGTQRYKTTIECEINIYYNVLLLLNIWHDKENTLDIVEKDNFVSYLSFSHIE